MNNKVYFAGEKGVKIPTKIDENAGYDIYAFFEEDYILIQPHETVMIPTGLYSAFSKDYVAILKERGSTGTKGMCQKSGVIDSGYRGAWMVPITNLNTKPLYISKLTKEELIEKFKNKYMNKLTEDDKTEYIIDVSDIIDTSIEFKRLISLLDNAIIYPYSKAIAQAIFVPVPKLETETISIEELKAIPSVRGEGKLGSSNK